MSSASRTVPLYLFVLPLLYVPDVGFSLQTPIGLLQPSDFVLVLLYPAMLLGRKHPSGVAGTVKRSFLAFVGIALLTTLLIPLRYPDYDGVLRTTAVCLAKLAKFLAYALLGFLVARRIETAREARLTLRSLAVGGLILAAGMVWAARSEPDISQYDKTRIAELYKGSNGLSVALGCLGVFFMTVQYDERRPRWLRWFLSLSMFTGMVASLGRGGWLGAVTGSLYVGSQRKGRIAGMAAAVLIIAVLLVAVTYVPMVQVAADRLVAKDESIEAGDAVLGMSSEGRIATWRHEGAKIVNAPLLGVGFDNKSEPTGLWDTGSHNFFIQMALETGCLGLFALLVLLWSIWRSAPIGMLQGSSEHTQQLNLAFRGGFAATCVGAMSGSLLYGTLLLGTISLLYGLVAASNRFFRSSPFDPPLVIASSRVDQLYSRCNCNQERAYHDTARVRDDAVL